MSNKVELYYDVNLTEFVPTSQTAIPQPADTEELQVEIDALKQENQSLNDQLSVAIQSGTENSSAADQEATKEVILELRKTLGQGRVDSDFSTDFPYTPIIKPDTDTE
jgi:FtsZ-binding cell division protein ZapB